MSNYLLLTILTSSVIGIGALSLYFKNFIDRFRYPITIISSSMVCGLIFIHIFPEVFEIGGHKVGLAILGGLFLQMILENLTSGFEHGHLHHHGKKTKGIVIGLMIGLCLHAFIEGAPLLIDTNAKHSSVVESNIHLHNHDDHEHENENINNEPIILENEHAGHDHSGHDHSGHDHSEHENEVMVDESHVHSENCNHDNKNESTTHPESVKGIVKKEISLVDKYFWAIINHNIPITIVLSTLFISFGYSFRKSISLISIFAIAGPLGAFVGLWLLNIEGFMFFSAYLMAISTGMLLHIITHILTEHAHDRKKMSVLQQITSLAIGIFLVILIFGI
jgi:zinc transporter ZupT